MHSASKSEMPDRLQQSWKFLSGMDVAFRELKSDVPAPERHYMTIVIPVGVIKKTPPSTIAVGLQMRRTEAAKAASFMFNIDEDKLTEEDLSDACKECCNVLGGDLSFDDENKLGTPRQTTHEHFIELQKASTFTVTFSSSTPYEGHIVLTILFLTNDLLLNKI